MIIIDTELKRLVPKDVRSPYEAIALYEPTFATQPHSRLFPSGMRLGENSGDKSMFEIAICQG
jgi:hypothetical protein